MAQFTIIKKGAKVNEIWKWTFLLHYVVVHATGFEIL